MFTRNELLPGRGVYIKPAEHTGCLIKISVIVPQEMMNYNITMRKSPEVISPRYTIVSVARVMLKGRTSNIRLHTHTPYPTHSRPHTHTETGAYLCCRPCRPPWRTRTVDPAAPEARPRCSGWWSWVGVWVWPGGAVQRARTGSAAGTDPIRSDTRRPECTSSGSLIWTQIRQINPNSTSLQ